VLLKRRHIERANWQNYLLASAGSLQGSAARPGNEQSSSEELDLPLDWSEQRRLLASWS